MPKMSQEDRSEALIQVLEELEQSDIGFVLVGGYAISQFEPRFSTDLDLVIAPDDYDDVVAFLEARGFERTTDGWDDSGRDADHVTVRKTVRHSLARVREFWRAHGIWPETTPQELVVEYEGPSPADLEQAACTECRTNVWRTRHGPYVAECDTGAICGYCSYECCHRHRNNLEEIAGEQSVYLPPA